MKKAIDIVEELKKLDYYDDFGNIFVRYPEKYTETLQDLITFAYKIDTDDLSKSIALAIGYNNLTCENKAFLINTVLQSVCRISNNHYEKHFYRPYFVGSPVQSQIKSIALLTSFDTLFSFYKQYGYGEKKAEKYAFHFGYGEPIDRKKEKYIQHRMAYEIAKSFKHAILNEFLKTSLEFLETQVV